MVTATALVVNWCVVCLWDGPALCGRFSISLSIYIWSMCICISSEDVRPNPSPQLDDLLSRCDPRCAAPHLSTAVLLRGGGSNPIPRVREALALTPWLKGVLRDTRARVPLDSVCICNQASATRAMLLVLPLLLPISSRAFSDPLRPSRLVADTHAEATCTAPLARCARPITPPAR